jgi:hypothetical protein
VFTALCFERRRYRYGTNQSLKHGKFHSEPSSDAFSLNSSLNLNYLIWFRLGIEPATPVIRGLRLNTLLHSVRTNFDFWAIC